MEEESIDRLIEELKRLRVQETSVISQIKAVNQRRVERDETVNRGTNTNPQETTHKARTEPNFSPGDSVYVTNRIQKPSNWMPEAPD
jgi:hypothetical protein